MPASPLPGADAPARWRAGGVPAVLALPELLRELSALLGRAYTTDDLALDLEEIGHPVAPSTVRLWLRDGIPARAARACERVRLYVRACGYAPHARTEDCAGALYREGGALLSLKRPS